MKIGNTEIVDVKIGTSQINKVMQGNNLVWEKSSAIEDRTYMLSATTIDSNLLSLTAIKTSDLSVVAQVFFSVNGGYTGTETLLVNKKYVIVQMLEPVNNRSIIRVYSASDLSLVSSSYNTTIFSGHAWYYTIPAAVDPDDDEHIYVPPLPMNGSNGAKLKLADLSIVYSISQTSGWDTTYVDGNNGSSTNLFVKNGYFYFSYQRATSPYYVLTKWDLSTNQPAVSTYSFDGIDSAFYSMDTYDNYIYIVRNQYQTNKILVVNLTTLEYVGVSPALSWYNGLPTIFKIVNDILYCTGGSTVYKILLLNSNGYIHHPSNLSAKNLGNISECKAIGVKGNQVVFLQPITNGLTILSTFNDQTDNLRLNLFNGPTFSFTDNGLTAPLSNAPISGSII